MKVMLAFWVICIGILFLLRWESVDQKSAFYGVATSTSVQMTQSHDVIVERLLVNLGDLVRIGDTLAVLKRPELELKIKELEGALLGEMGKSDLRKMEISQEAQKLESDYLLRTNTLHSEIKKLENVYLKNKEISEAMGAGLSQEDSSKGLLFEIKTLKHEMNVERRAFENQKKVLEKNSKIQVVYTKTSIDKNIEELEKEKKGLVVLAEFDGVVVEILKRDGERVPAFEAVMVLASETPTLIKGFVLERDDRILIESQKLNVKSLYRNIPEVEGVVTGVGTRIMAMPERMRKMPDQLLWGREVLIKIPQKNKFLVGEKLELSLRGE